METAARQGRGRLATAVQPLGDPYLAIIALAPIYLLFASSNWIFSSPESIDPWVYNGFFRNLQEYKTILFPQTYYGSRLSWILPGFIAYKFLPPLAANYVLHLGLWYASAFAAYWTLKTIGNREIALIGSLFIGTYTYLLRPLGWDYVDGPANAYLLVCFAFLTFGAVRKSRTAIFFGGMFCIAVVYTNLFTIVFVPVVILYFLVLSYQSQGGRVTVLPWISSLMWFAAGMAVLSIFLGCVNFIVEGNFWFYSPSIDYMAATAGQPNPWRRPFEAWLGRADWIMVPVAVSLVGLVALASSRFRKSPGGLAAVAAHTLILLIFLLCELRGLPVLQFGFYASYLTPTMFLVIGALLANPVERWNRPAAVFLAVMVLAAGSLPLWNQNGFWRNPKLYWAVLPALFGAIAAGSVFFNTWTARCATALALVCCHLSTAKVAYAYADRHVMQQKFARILQAADTVDAVRQGEPVRFWYSAADPLFGEFNALNAIYLWGYTMIGNEFPKIGARAIYPPGTLVVLASSDPNALARANEVLKAEHLAAEFLERSEIRRNQTGFSLSFFRIAFDYEGLRPQTVLPCAAIDCRNLVDNSSQVDLPLNGWTAFDAPGAAAHAVVKPEAANVRIVTVPVESALTAEYGPLIPENDGRYVFRLQYQVASGGLTFGATSENQAQWFAKANGARSRTGQTALLSFDAKAGESFWLVVSNNHPRGNESSEFSILALNAYEFPASDVTLAAQSAIP